MPYQGSSNPAPNINQLDAQLSSRGAKTPLGFKDDQIVIGNLSFTVLRADSRRLYALLVARTVQ